MLHLTTYSDNSKHKRNKNIHEANFDNISCKFNDSDWMNVFNHISTQEACNVFLKTYIDIIQSNTQYLKGKREADNCQIQLYKEDAIYDQFINRPDKLVI